MPTLMSPQHYPERWVVVVAQEAILKPFNSFGRALHGEQEAIIAQLNTRHMDVKSNRPFYVAQGASVPVTDVNLTWRERQIVTGKDSTGSLQSL